MKKKKAFLITLIILSALIQIPALIAAPESQAYTITDGGHWDDSTQLEQQTKVFKNPRTGIYYAIVEANERVLGQDLFHIYNSTDGQTWNHEEHWSIFGHNYTQFYENIDFVFWEDDPNNRLILMMVGVWVGTSPRDLDSREFSIYDNGTLKQTNLETGIIISELDDGIYNPSVELDDDGYIWVSWTDDWTDKGQQRNNIYVLMSNVAYPTSSGNWFNETETLIFDGETLTKNPSVNAKSELVRLFNQTDDMAIVYAYEEEGQTYGNLSGRLMQRGFPVTVSSGSVDIDNGDRIQSYYMFSAIAENTTDSDVYILFKPNLGNDELAINKWDISADSISIFEHYAFAANYDSLSLGMNYTANPNHLIRIGINDNEISGNYSRVNSADFRPAFYFDESEHAGDIDYRYLSMQQYVYDEIMIAYINTTGIGSDHWARFYKTSYFPEQIIPNDPTLLNGAGFNSTQGFVELNWQHDGANYTDYEIQNSTDSVSFAYLDNVTLQIFNHTGLINGSYHYYRVRARNYIAFYDQYFNSSWTLTNLEKVYYIKVGATGVAVGNGAIGFILMALIFTPIAAITWRKRR